MVSRTMHPFPRCPKPARESRLSKLAYYCQCVFRHRRRTRLISRDAARSFLGKMGLSVFQHCTTDESSMKVYTLYVCILRSGQYLAVGHTVVNRHNLFQPTGERRLSKKSHSCARAHSAEGGEQFTYT